MAFLGMALMALAIAVAPNAALAAGVVAERPEFTPRFKLQDTKGKTITEADFKGRFLLITFGYTFCPDICPTTLNNIAQAFTKLGPKTDRISVLFVTIDPERDLPEHLATYMAAFDPRFQAATGTTEQIAEAARNFSVVYRKAYLPGVDSYFMDHTARVYFIGPNGETLGRFSHTLSADDLAGRIAERMARVQP